MRETRRSYHEQASYRIQTKSGELPECREEEGCNGLEVVVDGKLKCIDLLGTSELSKLKSMELRED